MSSSEDPDGLDVDAALNHACESVAELANLELAINERDGLSTSETHLLSFGVRQGWVTCFEYLAAAGLIDIHYGK